ncbi:RHS repeat-associated core domain-containing protein [Pseudomonas sp. IT-P176]|uniref:RHS repeat-associated core domain-containing protein n=1 Tax=Pseudomonas sp. IT-P176 TaxID=3026444 RepID=UPI0039DF4300
MPTTSGQTLLCSYRYDPLDRLDSYTQPSVPNVLRFYCKNRLATEIQGAMGHRIVRHDYYLLAQQQCHNMQVDTTLLATDQQCSVLRALDATQTHALVYTPYGQPLPANGVFSLLMFNGEQPDPQTGHYLLGNGYRAFNPVLMRFHGPDSLSPFGKGGLNAYAYCLGDPVNRMDPTGNASFNSNITNKMLSWLSRARKTISAQNPGSLPKSLSGPTEMSEFKHVSYHGTSSKNVPSLTQGLDPRHSGANGNQALGIGFYTTDEFDIAVRYARIAAQADNSPPVVLKVYVKDFHTFKSMKYDENDVFTNFRIKSGILEYIQERSTLVFPTGVYDKIKLQYFDNPAWVSDYRVIGRRRPKPNAYQIRKTT